MAEKKESLVEITITHPAFNWNGKYIEQGSKISVKKEVADNLIERRIAVSAQKLEVATPK